MPNKNGKNDKNLNASNQNSGAADRKQRRAQKLKAKQNAKKKVYRPANSGKFEHLRKEVESFKKTRDTYIRMQNRKLAQEMAQQNNEPKPESVIEEVNQPITEPQIKQEDNFVVEEPKKTVDEAAEANDVKTMNLDDIDDSELDDPALDAEIEKLEQKMKKEEELKANGIDPETVEEPDDPELTEELKELMKEPEQKLEGAALEEAFQSLSAEVDDETKDVYPKETENEDPELDEEVNRIEQEIKMEEEQANRILTEKPPVVPRKPPKPESIFEKNLAHRTVEPEKKSLNGEYKMHYMFPKAELKKIFSQEREFGRSNAIGEIYEENDIIEAEYEIEEIEHKINEKDSVVSHRVSIPDFDDLLAQRMGNQEATSQVVNMLSDILGEAGIRNQKNEPSLADSLYQKLSKTMENNTSLSGKDCVMYDVAVGFFDESYNALGDLGLNTVDRVVAAQRIADVMMKGYSPLGFVYGELDKYTESYVMTNNDLLKQRLIQNGKFSEMEAEELAEGVMSRLDNDSAKLQAEFEARYGEGITPENELLIYVPDFHRQYDERIDNELVAENVKKQIADILRSSEMARKEDLGGDEEIDVDEKINETVNSIYDDTVRNIRFTYDYNSVGCTVSYMANWNYETTLKALSEGTMLPRNPIVTAQRISDVILKTYTPIAFAEKGALNRYADNYVIKNKDDLKERLESVRLYSEEEIEALLQRDFLAELRRELKGAMQQIEQKNDQPEEQQAEDLHEQKENEEELPSNVTDVKNDGEQEIVAEDQNQVIDLIQPEIRLDLNQEPNSTEPIQEDSFNFYNGNQLNEQVQINIDKYPSYINERNKRNIYDYGDAHFVWNADIYNEIQHRLGNQDVGAQVWHQLGVILSEAGFNVEAHPNFLALFHENMPNAMFSIDEPGDNNSLLMSEVSGEFFVKAYAMYNQLNEAVNNETKMGVTQLMTVQKIADLMLKNYSPVAIVPGDIKDEYETFADNYVLQNKAFLKKLLLDNRFLDKNEIESLIGEMESLNQIEYDTDEIAFLPQDENEIPLFDNDELSNNNAGTQNEIENVNSLFLWDRDLVDSLLQRANDPDLAGQVNPQLNAICSEAGSPHVNHPTFADAIRRTMLNVLFEIAEPADDKTLQMQDLSAYVFAEAYDFMRRASPLPENSTELTKIMTAQKIADVILNNYSPVPYMHHAYDKYADSYMLKNSDLLRKTLIDKGWFDIDDAQALIEQIDNELNPDLYKEPDFIFEADNGIQDTYKDDNRNYLERNDAYKLIIEDDGDLTFVPAEDFFKDLNARVDDPNRSEEVISELADILKEAGVNSPGDRDFAKFIQESVSRTMLVISDVGEERKMNFVVGQFFIRTCGMLRGEQWGAEKVLATAQKITDVMLKHYSPVGFESVVIDRYANNYVLGNRELFEELIQGLSLGSEEREAEAAEEEKLENDAQEIAVDDTVQENIVEDIVQENTVEDTVQENIVEDIAQENTVEDVAQEIAVDDTVQEVTDFNREEEEVISDVPQNEQPEQPVASDEERKEREIAFAKQGLEELSKHRGGLAEDMRDRENLRAYYQGILDKYKTDEELYNESLAQAEQKRQEQREKEAREKELKEQAENSGMRDIIEDEANHDAVAGEENGTNLLTNENPKQETIYIPDFHDRLDERFDNNDVTRQVMSELKAIIKSTGIEDDQTADDIAERSYSLIADGLKIAYIRDGIRPKTRDAVESYFDNADYALRDTDLSVKDRLITAQRIADVMIKNYSPITFADHKLDYYADNYVLKDDELLRKQLSFERLTDEQMESMIRDIRATIAAGPEKNQAEPKVNPESAKEKSPIMNAFDDDDFIDGSQPDSFERKLAEQQKAKEEAEKAKEEKAKKEEPKKEAKKVEKKQEKAVEKKIDDKANIAVFMNKLNDFNRMYKLSINADKFASSVIDAWALMKSGDKAKAADGGKIMGELFKDTLDKAFKLEKDQAYNEHRLPEYVEIIKSTNELVRSAMYGFTDLYHSQNAKGLFDSTAFGGLNADEMSKLTVGDSFWSKDQKSDEAWAIQSKEAKDIADKWLSGDKPYEKMVEEMKLLVEANKNGILSRKEILDKLTAAEWLLVNNEKMMVEDPNDPINPIPNWGNRYWKAITETREALGIDKHTSMRDMIQSDYAALAKAVNSASYNKLQIDLYILDPDVRELADSMEVQKEQFAIQSAAVNLTEPKNEKQKDELEMTEDRVPYPVEECNEFTIQKSQPKVFSNLVIEHTAEVNLSAQNRGSKL